jgi:hypothetical protein
VSVDSDLSTLHAFLKDFEQYLKSDVVFWTVGSDMPALTIGGLLFIRRTLSARRTQLSPAQSVEFDQLESQADALFQRWPVNIEKKVVREISSRLNVWASAIEEGIDHPTSFADNYAHSVNHRVYLSLLLPLVAALPEADPHRRRLSVLDARLRNVLIAGDFVWDAPLTAAFPAAEFWFLYGRPQKPQAHPK